MLTIRLLGPPAVHLDGRPARAPRGRKSWALLAYLLLAERPQGRQHLAELLFGDADDPLGALRWTLAELRRALAAPGSFTGDPVRAELPGDAVVDVAALAGAGGEEELLHGGGELLEGVTLAGCPAFESWLLVARHRAATATGARLRQHAMALLAAGRAADAVPYAARVVALDPLDEAHHELLVRALAAAGDREAALAQVAVCEDVLRRELGVAPSPALRDAVRTNDGSASVPPTSGRSAALSQLEAGRAAIAAGAVEAGLQCLRRAVADAARAGDDALRARTALALGGSLVHAVRGRDEEGAVVLHEAIAHARRGGDRATAAAAHRELGFVEVQAGRRATGEEWLRQAEELADTGEERAAVLGVRGMNASDRGDYPAAFELLGESAELAGVAGAPRQRAWSLSLLGRAHLLRGERSVASSEIEQSIAITQEQRWLAFLPWPQALRAELDLHVGALDEAAEGFEQAWTMACQLGDPCWEGMAARGLGLLLAVRGDGSAATRWLGEAAVRANRSPDRYQWVLGHVLDTAAGAALDRGDEAAARSLATRLASLSARCELGELTVRAHLHRARLGDPDAVTAARLLARDIDNPALAELLA